MTREPVCARCGFPRREHNYNGACYGVCGEFAEPQAMTDPDSFTGACPTCGQPYCKAEIERLTAERNEGARWRREGEAILRAEVERLQAAMIAAIQEDYRYVDGDGAWRWAFFRVKGVLRRALEPKP
jgi:hypothetical protein